MVLSYLTCSHSLASKNHSNGWKDCFNIWNVSCTMHHCIMHQCTYYTYGNWMISNCAFRWNCNYYLWNMKSFTLHWTWYIEKVFGLSVCRWLNVMNLNKFLFCVCMWIDKKARGHLFAICTHTHILLLIAHCLCYCCSWRIYNYYYLFWNKEIILRFEFRGCFPFISPVSLLVSIYQTKQKPLKKHSNSWFFPFFLQALLVF